MRKEPTPEPKEGKPEHPSLTSFKKGFKEGFFGTKRSLNLDPLAYICKICHKPLMKEMVDDTFDTCADCFKKEDTVKKRAQLGVDLRVILEKMDMVCREITAIEGREDYPIWHKASQIRFDLWGLVVLLK